MSGKYILPILALLGILLTLVLFFVQRRAYPIKFVNGLVPIAPYASFVAGEGIIEGVNRNIEIGVPFAELVAAIYVRPGDLVKKDAPLLALDTRQLNANLKAAIAAQIQAETMYKDKTVQFQFYKQLQEKSAVSEQEYQRAFYEKEEAFAALKSAQEAVKVIQTQIDRSIIRAPVDGQVLAINTQVGETANPNSNKKDPLITFADFDTCNLRINIAEEDAWRVIPGAPGRAYVRGHPSISFELEFHYLEPLMIPKVPLTGLDTERVDTRVLQILYRFNKKTQPVYTGQLLDVFLEAKQNDAH